MHLSACLTIILLLNMMLWPQKLFATSFTFSGVPTSISDESPFEIQVSLAAGENNKNKSNYLRSVFYVAESTKYFGYIQSNNGDWGNSASQKNLLHEITLNEEGSWSGIIRSKIDIYSSYYTGSGIYYFKIGRYTSESDTSAEWSDISVPITITIELTPTPHPTTKPSITPSQSAANNSEVSTQNESPTPPSSSPSPTAIPSLTANYQVLGATSSSRLLKTGIKKSMPSKFPTKDSPTHSEQPANQTHRFVVFCFIISGITVTLASFAPWIKKILPLIKR